MEETCCTVDEAVEAVMTGKRVAPPKYMTNATYDTYKLDGTTKAARAQLDGGGSGDFFRAYDYGAADDPKNAEKFFIKDKDSLAFGFTFPDGTSLKANAGVHKGNIPQILDKLESLAGRVHPRQQTALLFAVSQAGICALKGGLETYGIASSEHAAVNFTLSRDDATGAITVKYESPKALPFSFEWTATVSPDGYVSTTPLKFLSEQQLADAHKADVEELKNAIGGGNSNPVRNEAAEKAAELIVASAAGDRDLMDLLKMDNYQVVKGFARDFRNEVRSPDEIAVRLQRVKENLDELRTATKGDPRLFQTGLKHLVLFNGGALKSGTITRLCEMAANLKAEGKTLLDRLQELREEFGYYAQKTLTFQYEGQDGAARMQQIMEGLRRPLADFEAPLLRTARRVDYLRDETGLPKSDVMEFNLENGQKFIVRPSGTEPKLKAYLFSRGTDQPAAMEALAALEPLVSGLCG